jgi:hypothetical protein
VRIAGGEALVARGSAIKSRVFARILTEASGCDLFPTNDGRPGHVPGIPTEVVSRGALHRPGVVRPEGAVHCEE